MKADYDKDIIELVLKRIDAMPENIQIHMGNSQTYDKEELLKHVKQQDSFGKRFVEMQKQYLKASITGFSNV